MQKILKRKSGSKNTGFCYFERGILSSKRKGQKAVDFSEMIILVWISICLLG